MNKKEKTILPKLRFLEFKNYPEWSIYMFGTITVPVVKRAGTKKYTLMSVTSGIGLVSQIEKFGREIAGSAYKNYYVIKKNDFAYNKSATKQFPEGYISMLTEHDEAALPNSIFTCFRITDKECSPKFFDHLFHLNYHGSWLRKYIEVGARAHGSLSVDTQLLWNMPIALPKLKEQQKIADCLTSLNDLISDEDKKLETLKTHKKGLMQKLFPAEGKTVPEWRFSEFRDSDKWKKSILGKICKTKTGKLDANAMVKKGLYRFYTCAKEFYYINKYAFDTEALLISGNGNVGYIHYYKGKFNAYQRTYVLSDFKENIIYIKYFLENNLSNRIEIEKNIGNTPYIVLGALTEMNIMFPCDPKEQHRIANCLDSVDNLITAQTQKIQFLKKHKKALMQGFFPSIAEVNK